MNLSHILFPSLILLILSLNISSIIGIPVEDTIKADVVRNPEDPSKTEPIQATPKHLVPRPVWTSYYSRSFSIRCDEPGVAFDQAQARSASHADRLVPWNGPITFILGAGRPTALDVIAQFTILCRGCKCMYRPGRGLVLETEGDSVCPDSTRDFSSPTLTPVEVTIGGKRKTMYFLGDQIGYIGEDLPAPKRRGGLSDVRPGQFDSYSGSGRNVIGSIEPPRRQLAPGTKEPYYLEGPESDADLDPLSMFPFGKRNLDDSDGFGIFKRDGKSIARRFKYNWVELKRTETHSRGQDYVTNHQIVNLNSTSQYIHTMPEQLPDLRYACISAYRIRTLFLTLEKPNLITKEYELTFFHLTLTNYPKKDSS
ncbi:hypothetical protein TWF788_005283 [Orbilia oligospora]|uniref:Uncharacterized protein n=1 Tax=Orbilia oligospora TaxID=2813651 RepID=A0A7C8K0E0_ORBOL|nr:hypothetical protein TWF788_005283 [Orbilia oligospora]